MRLNSRMTTLENKVSFLERKLLERRRKEEKREEEKLPEKREQKVEKPEPVEEEVADVPITCLEEETEVIRNIIPEEAPNIFQESVAPETEVIRREKSTRSARPIKKEKNELWEKIETQFIENWTGILGSVILVAGIVFLGIYAAFHISPFSRFSMIVGASGVLFGLFGYLKSKNKWIKLGLWLRSSAGAVFLFACLGAGGIDELKWIDNSLYAYFVLVLGISINLILGFVGGKQVFASLHVLLSLIALSVAPQNNLVFITGTIITLIGILFTLRERWDYHLLLTVGSYFAYHMYWYFQLKDLQDINTIGIVSSVLVGLSGALIHYRKIYKSDLFDIKPFSVHLANWGFLGIALFFHSVGSYWKPVYIFSAAIIIFSLARYARGLSIRWLYSTDTLVSMIIGIIGVISLDVWELSYLNIMGIGVLYLFLFMVMMIIENEEDLYNLVKKWHISAIYIFGFYSIYFVANFPQDSTLMIAGVFVVTLAYYLFIHLKKNTKFDLSDIIVKGKPFSYLSLLSGILFVIFFHSIENEWWSIYLLVLLIPLFRVREKYDIQSLAPMLMIVFIGFGILYLSPLSAIGKMTTEMRVITIMPLLLYSLSFNIWSYHEGLGIHKRRFGIYTTAIVILFGIWLNFHAFWINVSYLVISTILFEGGILLRKKTGERGKYHGYPDRYLFHVLYVMIGLFLLSNGMWVVLDSEYIGFPIYFRYLLSGLGVMLMIYYSIRTELLEEQSNMGWKKSFPLFPEIALGLFLFVVLFEIDGFWSPLITMIVSLMLLLIGSVYSVISRFKLYSVIIYFAALMSFSVSAINTIPSFGNWDQNYWLYSCGMFATMAVYVIYFRRNNKMTADFPKILRFLKSPNMVVETHINKWIFFPAFISLGIFIFGVFDKSILTLLWVTESFAIFALSIFLRERYFRYFSLWMIVLSVIRLIFFDLSNSDTITKAMVFLGVGVLLLLMHSIYNKYKERFSDNEASIIEENSGDSE